MLYLYTLQLEKLEKKGYKLYMNQIKPMLLTTLKSYDRSQFVKDVTAGIIVAIIALPLSIALALASGVGPQAGIFTAIVAGFVISAFGGSSVQIAGPTAAFATIVAGIVAEVCEARGITVVFSHVNEQPMKVMDKAGFTKRVGKENFQPNISAALKRAEEVIAK